MAQIEKEGARFTAYFWAAERRALESEARRQNTSLNHILRIAVREYVGRDALATAAKELAEESTLVTGNK